MARPLRIDFTGALYHVMSRGVNGEPIFREEADYLRFLEIFAQTVARFGWIVYAWVLMTNHFHLEVCTPEANLSQGMHWLKGRYAQWFNRKYQRRGHLFGERFKALLVERESYLLEVARYIVRNPVRAGMVARAGEYRWSSYRGTVGLGSALPGLDGAPLRRILGGDPRVAATIYEEFVARGNGESDAHCRAAKGQIFLGSDSWLQTIADRLCNRAFSEEHPQEQLLPLRPRFEDVVQATAAVLDRACEDVLRDPLARRLIAWIAFQDGLYRQIEIARELGLPRRSAAGSLIARCRRDLLDQTQLAELAAAIRKTMKRHPPTIAPPPSEFTYPFRRKPDFIPGVR